MCRVRRAGCLCTATPGFGGWLAASRTLALTPTFFTRSLCSAEGAEGSLCPLCQSREGKGTWEPRKFSEQEWPCPVFLSLLLQVPLPCQTQKRQCPQHHPGPLSPYARFVIPRHSPEPQLCLALPTRLCRWNQQKISAFQVPRQRHCRHSELISRPITEYQGYP